MLKLTSLNKEQRAAVTHVDGPAVIVAGAGTGKTRTIAFRAAFLIEQGIPPQNILAITFTNKAAREMRERISKTVGADACALMTVSTIHSLCARMLREDIGVLGRRADFGISAASDQAGLVRRAVVAAGLDPEKNDPRKLLWRIGMVKNTFPDVDAEAFADPMFRRLYEDYNKLLEKNNTLDFDDLLIYTIRALENKKALKKYQERFKYIMVDEFQDVNGAQYEIVRRMAAAHRNLYVVGDDDQSIYGWRGARVKNILNFEKDFKGARVVRLERNYRSTSVIIDAANAVIANNTLRRKKKLWTAGDEGMPIGLVETADEGFEADAVLARIMVEREESKLRFGDFAILYRTNAQSRPFEDRLVRMGVSYIMIGGTRFYERREIKDMTAYLCLLTNREDDVSALRIVNFPPRGIGKTSLQRIREIAAELDCSVFDALPRAADDPKLSPKAREGVRGLLELFDELERMGAPGHLAGLMSHLIKRLRVKEAYEQACSDKNDARRRFENVVEFGNAIEEYERSERRPTLEGFLERIALMTEEKEIEEELKEDSVALMTMHGAKGLEFRNVFIVGAEEGFLPHENCASEEEIEEERRLFYVGMTRARQRLFISLAASRRRFGETRQRKQSRFIGEIPPRHITREDNAAVLAAQEEMRAREAERNLDRIRAMLDDNARG